MREKPTSKTQDEAIETRRVQKDATGFGKLVQKRAVSTSSSKLEVCYGNPVDFHEITVLIPDAPDSVDCVGPSRIFAQVDHDVAGESEERYARLPQTHGLELVSRA